jgi:CDP-6-deoxy-D-xylo-4-hexulose-3-dehydrase
MAKNYWLGKVEKPSADINSIKLVKSSFFNEADTKKALIEFITNTDRLSMGEQCLQFEDSFAKKQGRKYAVYVSSGSMANLILVQALLNTGKLKKGDKVGFSALTWPTNVMPLIQLGLVPVALDCNLETLNVSPRILENKINDIKGLFITNVLGFSDNIVKIKELCDKNNVILFEDNCESLGSEMDNIKLGNFGIASTFSFFVGHHMSTIEGGMICTDDEELNRAMTMARAHGWDRNLNPATQNELRDEHDIDEFYARYTFYDLAYNGRPSEINGFIGNQQIGFFDEIVSIRAHNFEVFHDAVKKNPDFIHYKLDHMNVISNFSMPLVCKDPARAAYYKKKFNDADVEIRPVIAGNMTKQPFYKKYFDVNEECPNADLVHLNGFYFGNNAELTEEELSALVDLIKE